MLGVRSGWTLLFVPVVLVEQVIFLVGIIVSQGVLLMDFANQLRKQGRTVHEAITQSAVIRFRPIIMTFLATFSKPFK